MNSDQTALEKDFFAHAPKYLRDQYAGIVAVSGRQSRLTSVDGSSFYDFASGGFGYSVGPVVAAVQAQMKKMALSNRIMVSRRLAELVTKLNDITPEPLSVSYVCNSGEEAFDGALKLAKGLNPKRDTLVVVRGSQPGSLSYGLLCAGHNQLWLSALPLKVVFVEPNDPAQLQAAVNAQTLAVVYEPILTRGQCLRLNNPYLAAVRRLCDDWQCVMLAYELRTGLGFSGALLASSESNAVPDVVVLGNALSGGLVPVGAYVTRRELNDRVYGSKNPSLHGSTTGGNPASCAAAIAAIDYLLAQQLPARHLQIGAVLSAGLEQLARTYPLTLAEPEGSFVDLSLVYPQQAVALYQQLKSVGVLVQQPQHNRIQLRPMLTTSTAEVDDVLERMGTALARCFEKVPCEVA